MKIVACSVGSKCFTVFKASVEAYALGHELIFSGPGGLPNLGKNFGEAYNDLLAEVFKTETECIVSNDDVVLRPDTMAILISDVRSLQAANKKVGWVGARSDMVCGAQNIRTFKSDYCPNNPADTGIKTTDLVIPIFAWVSRDAFLAAPFSRTHWYSDIVSCHEMTRLGYEHYVSRAYVHHVGSSSGNPKGTLDFTIDDAIWLWKNMPEYAKRYGLSKPA